MIGARVLAFVALSQVARARCGQGLKRFGYGANYANAFCCLLINGSATDCLKMITKRESQGLRYEALVDRVFAPAARILGQKWNNSDLSFSEVSNGISTLLLVNAKLRTQTAPVPAGVPKHVLFGTLPHQAHTLGIILAAEAFRWQHWDVEMMLNAVNDRAIDYVSRSQVGLVGVTAGREGSVEPILSLCDRLSQLPRPRSFCWAAQPHRSGATTIPMHVSVSIGSRTHCSTPNAPLEAERIEAGLHLVWSAAPSGWDICEATTVDGLAREKDRVRHSKTTIKRRARPTDLSVPWFRAT